MKLLKFSASWCNPCKMLTQIIIKAGDKITVPIVDIDIDVTPAAVGQYKIRSVPTLILLGDNNVEIDRMTGLTTESALIRFLDQHGPKEL